MLRIMIVPLALVLAAPVAWGLDEKAKDPPKAEQVGTPKEQFESLQKEFDKTLAELQRAHSEAKTQEEKQKIVEKFQQFQAATTTKMLELGEKNAKDPAAVDALVWVLQRGRSMPDLQKAFTALTTQHVESERIGSACAAFFRMPDGEKHVRAIIEKNKHPQAQGQARLALANNLKQRAVRGGQEAESAKLTKEAEQMYEEIIAKYGGVEVGNGKLGDLAKGQLKGLKAMANLVVGKEAPDIVGPDVDGKEFKLSDYRGKVVLLDFWAHW